MSLSFFRAGRSPARRHALEATAVFAFVLLAHCLSPAPVSGDSRWTIMVAESIVQRHTTNLDAYKDLIKANAYYGIECIEPDRRFFIDPAAGDCPGGHFYNWYPIGVPVLAAPLVVLLQDLVPHLVPGFVLSLVPEKTHYLIAAFLQGDLVTAHLLAELVIASFFVALASAVVFLTARRFLNARYAAGIALVFAFATSAWSTASRGLFPHGPSMLMIALTIYLLIAASESPKLAVLAALPVAFSYVIRPTDSLLVAVATTYVLIRHRRHFWYYLACALPIAAGLAAYNVSRSGSILSAYYSLHPPALTSLHAISGVAMAMSGNLISPSRGLLIFSPVLVFSVVGMVRALRTGWLQPLSAFLIALVILHWIVISLFVNFWWGGHSYGPRLFSDMLPVFALFLIPVLKGWQETGWHWRVPQISFVLLLAISVFIHGRGAVSYTPHAWNPFPANVDLHPERVWDWSDPEFLRGLPGFRIPGG